MTTFISLDTELTQVLEAFGRHFVDATVGVYEARLARNQTGAWTIRVSVDPSGAKIDIPETFGSLPVVQELGVQGRLLAMQL